MTEIEKRNRVLAICSKYVGVKEEPMGSNNVFFNTRFYGVAVRDGFDLKGKPNKSCTYAWCFTSVSEIFIEAGFPLGNIGWNRGASGVPYAIERISKWGRLVSLVDAQPGDIMMIDFNRDGRWDHVTIIENKALPHVYTYEGNTSSDEKGHQSNGGEFCHKDRNSLNIGTMVVRPNCYDRDYVEPKPVKINGILI